jgi:hypothetical protein
MVMVVLWPSYKEIARLYYPNTQLTYQKSITKEDSLQTDLPTLELKKD